MTKVATFLVEDNAVIRENLISALQELTAIDVIGYSDNESGAVEWLIQHPTTCKLVIIDIFLKSGSGLGVLMANQSPSAPVMVVLSNYATPSMRARCLQLGATRVFDKSNQLEDLLAYCGTLTG